MAHQTACDACDHPATTFVTSDYAFGGTRAHGSFRSYRCDEHARAVVEQLKRLGFSARTEPLQRTESRTESEHAGANR